MKPKRMLESVADQTAEMWKNGLPFQEIVDLIATEVDGDSCEGPAHEMDGLNATAVMHPFNLAKPDVNLHRGLYTAIREFGRRRLAAYKTVLTSESAFGQEIRTAVWMDCLGLSTRHAECHWLPRYLKLYVALHGKGCEIVRNAIPDGVGRLSWQRNASERLERAFFEDRADEFELVKTVEGTRFSKSLVRNLLKDTKGARVTAHLIRNDETFRWAVPPVEMLFLVCASCKDRGKASIVVEAIAETAPDCIQAADPFGQTPLDYVNLGFALRARDFIGRWAAGPQPDWGPEPWDGLAATLVRLGCNPERKNQFGISYADVRRAMQSLAIEAGFQTGGPAQRRSTLAKARKEARRSIYWANNGKDRRNGKNGR